MSASPPPDPPILATEVELRGIGTQVRVATVAWS
jgi:hypothetical protein